MIGTLLCFTSLLIRGYGLLDTTLWASPHNGKLAHVNRQDRGDEESPAAKDMEQEIFKMIRVSKTDKSQRQNMADFAKVMLEQINNMKDQVQTSHTSAQTIVNTHENSFNTCQTKAASGNNERSNLKDSRTAKSAEHKRCRAVEATALPTWKQCDSARAALESLKTSSCQALNEIESRVPDVSALPSSAGLTFLQWIAAIIQWAQNIQTEADAHDADCTKHANEFAAKTTECEGSDGNGGLKKVWKDKSDECDQAQTALESAACAAEAKTKDACGDASTCYDAAKIAWDSDEASLKSQEQSFTSTLWVLERLSCYVQVIIDAGDGDIPAAEINRCKTEAHDSDSMKLTWFIMPRAPSNSCPSVGTVPCSADYVKEEYSALSADAPHQDCTPCPASSGGGGGGGSGAGMSAGGIFAAGLDCTCAITSERKLRCSGGNVEHLGFTASFANDLSWQKISIGYRHMCGILADGSVLCTGNPRDDKYQKSTLKRGRGGWKYIDITSGYYVSCGVQVDKTLDCWGHDGSLAIEDVPTTHNGAYEKASMQWAEHETEQKACAVTTDGTAECWGAWGGRPATTKELGLVGTGWITVQLNVLLTDGGCGLKSDHTIECWGDGGFSGDAFDIFMELYQGRFKQLVVSRLWACGLLDDGGVVCWGGGQEETISYHVWKPGQGLAPTCQSLAAGFRHLDCQLEDGSLILVPDSFIKQSGRSQECPMKCWTDAKQPNEIYQVYGSVLAT